MNKPLLYYTISESLKLFAPGQIYLSTDSSEYMSYSTETLGLPRRPLRPSHFATDTSRTIDCVIDIILNHSLNGIQYQNYIILQPTSPLRTARHISSAICLYESTESDCLVSMVELPHCFNPEQLYRISNDKASLLSPDLSQQLPRQQKPKYYARNGAAIYIFKPYLPLNHDVLFSNNPTPYVMDAISSIDIDNYTDLQLAEAILSNQPDYYAS